MTMSQGPGHRLRQALELAADQQQILPFVGIYDLFSASLAADRFEALFLSGFGLAASAFGLPDIGFIGWGDLTTTSHVARTLERSGASGVVLEDQARPRRCGHLDGKQLLPLPEYLNKLEAVLADRSSLVVVDRTDASDPKEIVTRVQAFEQAGCDAVLADGLKDLELLAQIRAAVACPVFSNVIGGGKVPACSRADLAGHGVQGLIYSTPCLFAAQGAIEQALEDLSDAAADLSGALASPRQLSHCNAVLQANPERAGGA